MLPSDPLNITLNAGVFYFDRFTTAGARTGFRDLGDVSEFDVTPSDTVKEHYSSRTPDRGLMARALTQRKLEIALTGWEHARENIALATLGDEGDFLQSSATVTGEAVIGTDFAPGTVLKLANRNVSSVVLKQGATSFTLGTDFTVLDATEGLVAVPLDTTMVAGTAVTANYSAAALVAGDQKKIDIYTHGLVTGQLLFLANPAAGVKYVWYLWKLSLEAKALNKLLSDDFSSFDLGATALDDRAGAFGGSASSPWGRLFEYPSVAAA